MNLEVTIDEIEAERNSWERDGIKLSDAQLIKIIMDRKEQDLWSGNKMGKEGD